MTMGWTRLDKAAIRLRRLPPILRRSWPIGVLGGLTLVLFVDLLVSSPSRIMATQDILRYFVWLHEYTREHLLSGSIPLWNPYNYCGMPFAANPQASVFYPPAWLHCLLPVVVAQKLLVVIHTFLAGSFLYLFLRSVGLSRIASTTGALPYMCGGYVMTNAAVGHLTTLFAMAWLPLALAVYERFVRTGRPHWLFWTGLTLGVQLLAGEPQISYYTGLLLVGYGLIRATVHTRANGGEKFLRTLWRWTYAMALVALVAALTAAIQIVPTAEFALESDRHAATFEFATTNSMPPGGFIGMVLPWFDIDVSGFNLAAADQFFGQHWEWACYVGIITFVLIAFSFAVRKAPALVAARVVALIALIFMLGRFTPVYGVLLKALPGLSLFRIPPRASLLLVWAIAVMTAFGTAWILDGSAQRWRSGRWRWVAVTALAALMAIVVIPVHMLEIRWELMAGPGDLLKLTDPPILGAIAAISAAIMLTVAMKWMPRWLVSAAIPAVLALDLVISRPSIPSKEFSASTEASVAAMKWLGNQAQHDARPVRMDSPPGYMYSNAAMVAKLDHANGYMPMALRRYYRFAHRMRGYEPSEHFRSYIPDTLHRASDPFPLRIMNVRFGTQWDGTSYQLAENPDVLPRAWVVDRAQVLSDEEAILERLQDPSFDPATTVILEQPPRVDLIQGEDPPGGCSVRRISDQELEIRTQTRRPAYLVLSEVFYPGWKATIDGTRVELERADYLITALPLPAGSHTVTYRYDPVSFRIGATGTLVSCLCALVILSGRLRRLRRVERQPAG